jgi:hypothetical protein
MKNYVSRYKGTPGDLYMPRQQSTVRNDHIIFYYTIMPEVRLRHKKIVIAYHRCRPFTGTAMYGDIFPDNVIPADLCESLGALIRMILRLVPDDGTHMDHRPFAYFGALEDVRVGHYPDTGMNPDAPFHYGIRTNIN